MLFISRRLISNQVIILSSLFVFVMGISQAFSASPATMQAQAKIDLPSEEVLAKELGFTTKEFKSVVDDFAQSMSLGKNSKPYKRLCAKDENACIILSDFLNQNTGAKRERRRSRGRIRNLRITEKNYESTQSHDYRSLVRSLKFKKQKDFVSAANLALRGTSCPRNLSAALSVMAEEFFPDETAQNLSLQLFENAKPCLRENQVVHERLFLRQGLLALKNGDKKKAKDFLQEAKDSKTNTERYRVLYWLGDLANQEKTKTNPDWDALLEEYPLSYYAIEAAIKIGKDPLEVAYKREVGKTERTVVDDPELDQMIRWLESLYVYKKSTAVGKWASWIVRSSESELKVELIHYISTIKIASGLYRSNIQMLFSYFKSNPKALNEEGLKLLYPRPYYKLVEDSSKGVVDPYLVLALIRQESAFDPRAVSSAKAKGLMQIIPHTARRLASQGHRKLLNEKANTEMGVKYLKILAKRFDDRAELVLAGYNAGPNKVDEWLKRIPEQKSDPLLWNDLIPYMETRDYVVSILRNNYLYERLYGEKEEEKKVKDLFHSELVIHLLEKTPQKQKEES
ncbi:MAG: lytic transglycosylase domain-containing protein [Oligoflexia bacterium]|nr:lytic transglycosylase domain-containing protein [Oligoflexia bacterium]